MSTFAVILAAGGGTRMKSELPKPLHEVCGRPMVLHVISSLSAVEASSIVVVVGHGADQVVECVRGETPWPDRTTFAMQHDQRGTGDAASVGLSRLTDADDDDTILVMPGDTPLLTATTIASLVGTHTSAPNAATLLTTTMDDPTGYGRVVRSADGGVVRIVEHRDATADELAITEVNTGIYAFAAGPLRAALDRIEPNNSQSEYYLTDVIDRLVTEGRAVGAMIADPRETAGVNDREQLAAAEEEMRRRIDES